MRKNNREFTFFKAIATVTIAGMFGLSIPVSSKAIDSDLDGEVVTGEVVGLGVSGDFSFKKLYIMGFAHRPLNGFSGSSGSFRDTFFSIEDGVAKVQLPLLSFGVEIKKPGIFYNQNGEQFFDHIVKAASGSEESQTIIWPYVAGGVLLVGGVVALASGSGGDDAPDPVAEVAAEPVKSSSSSSSSSSSTSSSDVASYDDQVFNPFPGHSDAEVESPKYPPLVYVPPAPSWEVVEYPGY